MTVANTVAVATFFLENDHFVAFYVRYDFCYNLGSFYGRCAYFNFTVGIDEENFVELHLSAALFVQTVNKHFLVFFNLKLLSRDLNNSVHSL